jgi:hypothetical protein
MYTSIYYCTAGTSRNCGTYEYLMSFARQLLNGDSGMIEIRDAHGTLKASLWTENGAVVEWTAA